MNKEWIITALFISIGAILLSSSLDFNLYSYIPVLIKKLIQPITQGIFP
jgi:hypothetical protein